MQKKLKDIASDLICANKRVQLIYGFNGTGKTRLSKEFSDIVNKKAVSETDNDKGVFDDKRILYYNAFTEDLFYWNNNDGHKLLIHSNDFTKWILEDQGKENEISKNFQHLSKNKLTPKFNAEYTSEDDSKNIIRIPAFSEVTFSYERGNDDSKTDIKISKGEESCFIWSVFYSLLEQVVEALNIDEDSITEKRGTDQFDDLEYVFIDDPVSSLDDNSLIEIAVKLSELIKSSKSDKLKFIITTHNPIFYNVLSNDFSRQKKFKKYIMLSNESESYDLIEQSSDSPFSYHLSLLKEINSAINDNKIHKYHFSFLRNILEKTATFLGYSKWQDLLSPINGEEEAYMARILNFSSHSKHSAEEVDIVKDEDKKMLKFLVEEICRIYNFKV